MKFTLFLLLTSTMVWAQTPDGLLGDTTASTNSRPYYFSGPCTSQGSWTQEALTQTQRLREITTQLRDDPNCKALGESLQRSLGEIRSSLESTDKSMGGAQNYARDLQQEVKALRTSAMENPALSAITNNHIIGRLFKLAQINTLSNDQNNAIPNALSTNEQQQLMSSIGDRRARVVGRGFQLFNQTVDSFPPFNRVFNSNQRDGPSRRLVGEHAWRTGFIGTRSAGNSSRCIYF